MIDPLDDNDPTCSWVDAVRCRGYKTLGMGYRGKWVEDKKGTGEGASMVDKWVWIRVSAIYLDLI